MTHSIRILVQILFTAIFLVACGGGNETAPPLPLGSTYETTIVASSVFSVPADATPSAEACTVALYGDSILYGYVPGGRLAQTPAMTLKGLLPKLTITDVSFPGDSAYQHQQSFLNDPLASRIIVIQYGSNDATQSFPYETALRSEIQYAKSRQKIVIVTGISTAETTPVRRDAYDAIAQRVAAEEGVAFGNWGLVQPATTADGLHPDQNYSIALATALATTVATVAPECK